ncbi:bacteriophage abortive infection AbiH family protein (plasmid) [Alkalihalophilus pseudofirmus]|uniref:bacteriophage abortive infection AbiH family protein n=1 Tax=Alkalihalophilus pseudofirmus TaxID=79885 RepID=UPI00259B5EB9|nr:bacteriophage abortive infection AbiH family protein [Alkalihalophilus pseudofirmus]WEG19186.1 bacteriophage abortive infection AbiH family protein [Alkalihalophilus pseudofirmus]
MCNLFVIGNGFDLSHGLSTSYQDFKEFCESSIENITVDELIVPEVQLLPDGGSHYNEDDVISMLLYLISLAEGSIDKWQDVENSLGRLDFGIVLDLVDEISDKEGDFDLWKMATVYGDVASSLIVPTLSIQELFSKWVDSIDISSACEKYDFKILLNENDKFLTFNYTDTLEELYGIAEENVCHIHGRQYDEILFGHGDEEDHSEDHMSRYIGSEDGLSQIHERLRKDTGLALKVNNNFFQELKDIKMIYSYGFSFSKVDLIYLSVIFNQVDTSYVTWSFNDYENQSVLRQWEGVLKELGFKGDFTTFTIKN